MKNKPPTFKGDMRIWEEVEAWFLVMGTYFQIYDYSNYLKAIIETYNLNGR